MRDLMKVTSIAALAACWISASGACGLFSVSSAWADNPKGGGGLSQLEFDRPPVITPPKGNGPSEQDIRVILESEKPEKLEKTAATPVPSASAAPGSGKLQKFDWIKPADGQGNYLTPRLRGPQADPQHPSTITTEVKWGKQNGSCEVTRSDLLCDRARSLRELIFRFSGDPDFFSRQCQQVCSDPTMQPVLTAFKVKDRRGQGYDVLQAGDKCRYQLSSTGQRVPWLAMEGEAGTCMCLPKGCTE